MRALVVIMVKKFLNISKEKLEELYLNQKLSTDAIGKIYSCNHVTILNYLNKYNIPRRSKLGNRKTVSIPKEVLYNLYHNKKLTQKQIAQKFGHSRYGIQRWMKIYKIDSRSLSIAHTKYPKYDFSGNKLEKAYLIGFRLGDLNIYKIKNLVQARCSTTIEAQVILIKNLFKNYGNVHIGKAKRGTFEIIVLLNSTFDFLLPKQDNIEKWILENNEYFLSFLAGYSDAEGSFYLRKPYYKLGKCEWGIFEIQTFDKNIIGTIYKKLLSLNIEGTFSKSRSKGHVDKRGVKTNKDCWRLMINKKQYLWNFIKLIEPYHKHENKLKDLKKVKENLLMRNKAAYCKPIIL